MQIRDNIRRRRQARIARLLEAEAGQRVIADDGAPSAVVQAPQARESRGVQEIGQQPVSLPERQSLDPEIWWKQQQKQMERMEPAWRGSRGLSTDAASPPETATPRTYWSRMLSGLAIRSIISAILFGMAWIGFQTEWPGSREVRAWAVNAVTRDMDFQAALTWYEHNFGGSPAFLPMFRGGETKAVFGGWKRNDAVLPVEGRIVQTFAQDGQGIRIAAPGGSDVQAVYAGRVLRVSEGEDGRAEVHIQHVGRTVTIYGNLYRAAVQPNDWVEVGQKLGSVPAPKDAGGESLLYFAVWNDNRAIDPAEVIPFD